MQRKVEYYTDEKVVIPTNSFSICYEKYYAQERDWTCSIACIRTILSKFKAEKPEDYYILEYKLTPGPHYSQDIKKLGILKDREAVYGCDYSEEDKDVNTLIRLANQGYGIMIETLLNYTHWLVVIGYCIIGSDTELEKHKIIVYDPYYNDIRLCLADELLGMWIDINYDKNNVVKDFIAIK